MAADEVIALKQRHIQANNLRYTFEHAGKTVEATFVTATPLPDPETAYQIELLAPASTVADGQCYITDTHGKRVGGTATTRRGPFENRIIVETLALKP